MKKNIFNKGFMLAETLLVTMFVAGVLIYLFIQFTNLNKAYNETYIYNTIEGLYTLEDIKEYIESDESAMTYINLNLSDEKYIDVFDCSIFESRDYCKKILELSNIKEIIVTFNDVPYDNITDYSESFLKFVNKIKESELEPYRIIASFKDSTFATVRFGE